MALVQVTKSADTNDGTSTTVATAAFVSTATAGNTITGHISWQGATATATVTDGVTSGTVYDTVTIDTPNGIRMASYVIQNITAGGPRTITATFSVGSQYRRISAQEWSGVATTGQPNKHILGSSSAFGTGTDAVTSGTQTTTVNGCTIVGFAYNDSTATTPSIGTGFTNADSAALGAGDAYRVEYKTQSTAGSVAATFTTSAGTDLHGVAMLALENTAAPIVLGGSALTPGLTSPTSAFSIGL